MERNPSPDCSDTFTWSSARISAVLSLGSCVKNQRSPSRSRSWLASGRLTSCPCALTVVRSAMRAPFTSSATRAVVLVVVRRVGHAADAPRAAAGRAGSAAVRTLRGWTRAARR
ncbi:hypothetical protein VV38_02455 [Clavibacter nebraskensis]|nr:hypothetical protein VV38_02455 [Clavibacter nebraskensis]OAH22485.1 hypothetical protein A3Q38_00765 [Clavibacter nebraskensis]